MCMYAEVQLPQLLLRLELGSSSSLGESELLFWGNPGFCSIYLFQRSFGRLTLGIPSLQKVACISEVVSKTTVFWNSILVPGRNSV